MWQPACKRMYDNDDDDDNADNDTCVSRHSRVMYMGLVRHFRLNVYHAKRSPLKRLAN